MKKQTALLLSTLVLMSAVSMQPASALSLRFFHKKAAPVVTAPVKKEVTPVIPVKEVVKKEEVKKETPAVKIAPAAPAKAVVKPVVKPVAKPVVKPVAKAPVKK